jgi:hypothetical protein
VASIVLVTGPPGAGKSTVAHGIAEHFPMSAHLEVDDLREIMVNGFAPPGEWTDAVEAQFRRARRAATHLARAYHAAGIDFVIDDVCVPEHFHEHCTDRLEDPSVKRAALGPRLRAVPFIEGTGARNHRLGVKPGVNLQLRVSAEPRTTRSDVVELMGLLSNPVSGQLAVLVPPDRDVRGSGRTDRASERQCAVAVRIVLLG